MNNKILVVIDGNYFMYYTLFGAFSKWCKVSTNAKNLKPAEETDQSDLPDLLVYNDFVKCLHDQCVKRFETVDWLLKQNYQDQVDNADGIDIVFTIDDPVSNNWRKKEYPLYKAQRKQNLKQYNVYKILNYMTNVIFKELDIENTRDYHIVKVDNAEGDDVIATIFKNYNDYMLRVLFASDYDFMQLEDVDQFDLMGNKRETSSKTNGIPLSPKDYLLFKIIVGDKADNIPNIANGIGTKRALELVSNKLALEALRQKSKEVDDQFKLNEKIISFDNIPTELENQIKSRLDAFLDKPSIVNKNIPLMDADIMFL